MPITNLTWYQPKVRRIMKDVKALRRNKIAKMLNVSAQSVGQSIKSGSYDNQLTKWIQILDMAGYEIREKE